MTVSNRGFQILSKLTLIVALFLAGATEACRVDSRTLTSGSRDAGADASVGTVMKDGSYEGGPNPDGPAAPVDGNLPDGPNGSDSGVLVPKVTISIQRNGNGTITGDGINCTTASCDVTVDVGASLVLQANPGADSAFKEWSGCTDVNGPSCSLVGIMTSMQVTATFALKNANLVVIKDGNGTGAVAATWPGGGSLACGAACSAVVPKGMVVTLQATPDMGSSVEFGPPCTGSGPCMVTIGDTETDVRATFTLSKVTLTVTHTGDGTISGTGGISCADASCAVPVNYGSTVTLTAMPGADSDFASWTGCSSATGTTCVVSNFKAAATVNAVFTRKKIQVTIAHTGNGRITSVDGTVSCTMASCVVSVDSGASLSLTATADADSDFKSWSGCTTTSGATCSLTALTTATTVNATFAIKNASFVISKQGNGAGTVTATWAGGGNLNCGAVCSANIPQGTMVTVQGTPVAQSTLVFSGPCTGAGTCQLTVPAGGTTVVATFSLVKYPLTVQASGAGTVTGTGVSCTTFPCTTSLDSGTSIALTAAPAAEYLFSSWTGCSSTNGAICNVISINAATTVTAAFVKKKYPLTVQVSGNGTVTGSGVNCASASCVSNFDSGSTITLTANPGTDSDFKSWTGCTTANGATCTVSSIMAAATVTATFGLKNASFNISKGGNGAGTVTATWAGGSLSCLPTCSASIPLGTQVTVTATPQTGSFLATLSGAGCSTNPCTVTVATGGTTIAATFTLNQYLLQVAVAGPTGTGSVASTAPQGIGINCGGTGSCSAQVNHGTVVTLAATASGTGTFASWSGCPSPNGSSCSLTVTAAATVTANFKRRQGAMCSVTGDCSTGLFCVGSVCCGTTCPGTTTGCASCQTGSCLPQQEKMFCGIKTGPSPGQKTDTTLFCQNGACVAPTIDCLGAGCNLTSNACCVGGPNDQFSCFTPGLCNGPSSGDFFQGHACNHVGDCPMNYECCNQATGPDGTGHWSTCIQAGTCPGEVFP
jgi:hypothetical protein